jgi:hypothetical protein
MPINVTCPSCSATLRAPDTAVGKQIKCPKCQTVITVPGASALPESQMKPAAPPPPMASAAPAKAVVPDYDEDDRPRRRTRDDDEDDRPRRRWRRTPGDADSQSGGNNGLAMGLGIGAIALGLIAGIFAIIPCFCFSAIAWPAGVLGLLLGLIGLAVCLMAKQKNVGAIIMTVIGSVMNVAAIGIAAIWWIFFGVAMSNTATNVNQMSQVIEKANKDMERARQDQQDRMKKSNESANPATPAEKQLSQNNLKQLLLAMLNYNDTYMAWPYPRGGQPPIKGRLSWRVAILPYIEEIELYQKFKLDENWDSPANRKVLESNPMPKIFASPRPKPGEERKTYYQTFTGPFTMFPAQEGVQVKLNAVKRARDSLWLLAEAANPVDWTRPEDIQVQASGFQVGGIFDGDFNVGGVDGRAHYVRKSSFNNNERIQMVNPQSLNIVPGWPPPP